MIKEIYDYLKDIQIIDTHEHLAPFQKERPRGDVLTDFLEHYFSTDLISAGLSPNDYNRIMGDGLSITEKWSIVLENVQIHRVRPIPGDCRKRYLWH